MIIQFIVILLIILMDRTYIEINQNAMRLALFLFHYLKTFFFIEYRNIYCFLFTLRKLGTRKLN